jgi:shikimate kinase
MLRTLVLMGLRGSGKSTVGRHIADWAGRPFIDLDTRTAQLLGSASVREVWDRHGEAAFRLAETKALTTAMETPGAVIALGGGTPTAPGAAELLRRERDSGRCEVIYLSASARTLRERLRDADNSNRPSLTGADPLAEIEMVLAQRDPLYRELASRIVRTDGRDAADIAAEIE